MKDFDKKMRHLLFQWKNQYRKEMRDSNYVYLPTANFDPDLKGNKKRTAVLEAEMHLKNQMEFLMMVASFQSLSGKTIENFRRINRFIKTQLPTPKKPVNFSITFLGTCYGTGVTVNVEDFNDIDFTDSWTEARYEIITISSLKWNRWTPRRTKLVIEQIKEDFAFDGLHARIKPLNGKPDQTIIGELGLSLSIIEDI